MTGAKTGGWAPVAGLAGGALIPGFLPAVPSSAVLVCFLSTGFGLLWWRRTRWIALALLGFCWVALQFQLRLADRLAGEGAPYEITVQGVIHSVPQHHPEFSRFRFRPEGQGARDLPATLLVYWYRERPELAAGQRWALELKLRPPWGEVNFHGPDRERWLFAEGIGGVGSVSDGRLTAEPTSPWSWIQRWRERVMSAVSERVADERMAGFVRALATADTSALSSADRLLLRRTGTAHLLAISGLHIGLAAAGGALLGRLLPVFIPVARRGRAPWLLSLGCGLLAGLVYAALAGFGVATQRAVLMLACVLAALGMSRAIPPFRAWLLALAGVLVLDPFAALGPGFWFSFLAVAALLIQFTPNSGRDRWWTVPLRAQWAVMVALIPVTATWFELFSPSAFPANLVAVPWVSLAVVPFVLAGVALLELSGAAAGALWAFAALSLEGVLHWLAWLNDWQGNPWRIPSPGAVHFVLALAGAGLLMLPRGLSVRWLGIFLILPLFLPARTPPASDAIDIDILDAGQGTAVLVRTAGKALLYDSGPGNGRDFDRVAPVIAPALEAHGLTAPDRVVISHADLDHAGGLRSLLDRYPGALYWANHPSEPPGLGGCTRSLAWRWGAVSFRVLHPSRALPYRGNDSSCVISVQSPGNGLLLAGDISQVIEHRLLYEGLAPHPVLLVPHHGSPTSSGPAFIGRLQPSIAVATAGLGNRFGFPREEVRRRYLAEGAQFWDTGGCGGLRLRLLPDGRIRSDSARRARPAPWRWPAAPECP